MQVFDEDLVGKNDYLGSAVFDLSNLATGKAISGWHPLKDKAGNNEIHRGQLRVRMFYEQIVGTLQQSSLKFTALSNEENTRETKAEEHQHLDVFIGTWNVGNAPPPADLSPWIPKNKYTLYVIGTQECKYKWREGYENCSEDWLATLASHFGSKYARLMYKSLGQMRIAIFCNRDYLNDFFSIETATEATGIGHVMSNKGGVAISLKYHDTSICFVNAHLAAHQHKTARRNSDVQEIINGISRILGSKKADIVVQFDHVIFMGDLNYRLDYGTQGEEKKPTKEQFDQMVLKIEEKKFDTLFSCDQLTNEMAKGRVFCGFREGKYNFPPTFKVLRQKKLAYTSERSPSWCDRILWHSLTKEWVKQISLGVASDIDTSDHKPVYSVLRLPTYYLPSLSDAKVQSIRVSLEHVKCFRLPPMNQQGLANAYLQLMADFLPENAKAQSDVVKKSLNPVFSKISDVKCCFTNPDRLRKGYLIIKICDKDVMSASTIGYTVLPMRWFMPEDGKLKRSKMFRHHIMKGGVYVGSAVIQGKISVIIEEADN
eukprot:CAMPEP_0114496092 /NCGR_PEP_ID=MMETSP0109-20121206/5582_1 /TAXON_ID=29199 /ORGANISM="Chlorarachnion reptans, Strain CCCM449" /LENGTH=542 /DNA_ID=CAMNT_0001673335 /DNA_START=405 /DNA_END=2033 /DNA_ORIENTATION=+